MAWIRVSPGVYKSTVSGQTVRSATTPTMTEKAPTQPVTASKTPTTSSTTKTGTPATKSQPPAPAPTPAAPPPTPFVPDPATPAPSSAPTPAYNGSSAPPSASAPSASSPPPPLTAGVNPTNSPNTDDRTAEQRAIDQIRQGQDFGQNIANQYFKPGQLGRLDTARTPEQQDVINRLQSNADTAGDRSQLTTDEINRRVAGLGGYTAAENQGLLEQAQGGIDQQYTQQQYANAAAAARSGVRGGAATAADQNLDTARIAAQGGLNRDLMVENVAEKQRREAALENLTRNSETDEFNRRAQATGAYASGSQYQSGVDTAKQQFNIGQGNAENAGQLSSTLGGIGTYTGLVGNLRGEQYAQQNQQAMQGIYQTQADQYAKALDAYNKAIGK